jgi:hypothetical protein
VGKVDGSPAYTKVCENAGQAVTLAFRVKQSKDDPVRGAILQYLTLWPKLLIMMSCVCSVHAAGERHADGEHGAREDRRRYPRLPLRSHREAYLALLL